MPPLESRNRQTWQMVRVTVKPPAALGVDNAVIEFGHTPDLHCNPRNERCVAGAAGSEPYYFAGEAFTGVPCSAGCSIDVPSVPSRILYYRIKYRNSSNSPVAQSGILTVGVP